MKKRIFITIFIILCLVPSVFMLAPKDNNQAANEASYELPSVLNQDGKLNVNLLGEFFDYFDNNFGLRNQMISAHNKIVAAVFGESAEDKVILGKDDWLFYNETLADYEGTNLMTKRQLYSISRTLSLADEYLKNKGINFVFTIAPNKNSLYGEKMPDYYPKSSKPSNAQMLSQMLADTDVNYVNLFDAFQKESKVLYRKSDSHWTYEGAGLAADCILKALQKDFTPFYGGETYSENIIGDLHKMLYPSYKDKDKEILYKRDFSFEYSKPMRSVEDNFIYTQCVKKDNSLFMFRDSFGNTLHSLIADEFYESAFCRLIPYNLTLAESKNADTVVIEIVERNIGWLISKPPVFEAPKRSDNIQKAKDITKKVSSSIKESKELNGYTKIEGTIQGGVENPYNNIYIVIGNKTYEATPLDNSFVAFIPSYEIDNQITFFEGN